MKSKGIVQTKVRIANKDLPYPVIASSGTLGYGALYINKIDYSKLGALICKTLTLEEREGNPQPQIYKIKTGMLNSVGLKNPGLKKFINQYLPKITSIACPYIISLAAESSKQFVLLIDSLLNADKKNSIWGFELNLSCPNVSKGTDFGKDAKLIKKIVSTIRPYTRLPILVKLPPNVTDLVALAQAAEAAGADAISAVNTFKGMWIDTESQRPIFFRKTAGLSGEGIFPAALALVYELCQKIKIPVIGIGGISNSDQALQYLLAGARAVQIGTANYKNPSLLNSCVEDIISYCKKYKISNINKLQLKA